MFCSSCGKTVPIQGRFCVHCGVPTAAIQAAAVPVAVATPPPRTASEQGDYITGVAGRIGCNLLIGFIVFKIVVVIALIVVCGLFALSLGLIK
jgi:hypothetical protein